MKKAFALISGLLLVFCVSTSAVASPNIGLHISPGSLGFSYFDGGVGVSDHYNGGYSYYYPSYRYNQYYAPYNYWYQPYGYYYNPYGYNSYNYLGDYYEQK